MVHSEREETAEMCVRLLWEEQKLTSIVIDKASEKLGKQLSLWTHGLTASKAERAASIVTKKAKDTGQRQKHTELDCVLISCENGMGLLEPTPVSPVGAVVLALRIQDW